MSHKTELKTKLDNKKYILDALTQMDCKYKEAEEGKKLKTESQFSGVATDVDILVSNIGGKNVKNAVGLNKQTDGSFSIVGDYWGTGINERDFTSNLQMQSKKLETSDRLAEHGFDLSETLSETKNEVKLVYKRYV